LWSNWYRQSKAHNVVTFDGGQGQRTDGYRETIGRNGKINSFSPSATLDYVDADATPAYGGTLTLAKRQAWYLRDQDVVLIHDTLQAPLAHSFEWNLHAPVSIAASANGLLRITNNDRSLCIKSLGTSPTTYKPMTGSTPKTGSFEAHGAYVTAPAKSAEFLVLLDVGCKNPAVSVTMTATGRTVHIGDQVIDIAK
ncbi:MAG TPA: heparinase II/III family protein, partial [Burkholderiaceae bacterium]|nr:heparinase II/III family protein [Burkholderiaceae bacterium]